MMVVLGGGEMSQPSSGPKRNSVDGCTSTGPGAGVSGKKSRIDNITLRFLLQSKHAGGIIGKGGQTIKRLRSEYNATVSVPDSSTNERVLSVSASQENAINVLKECLPLFHEPPYPNNSSPEKQCPHEINFLVHSSQVGGVIGRAGAKIKELQEQTLATIKVLSNCLPSSTERVIIVGGSEDNIITALLKIMDLVNEQPVKCNVAFYDPNQEWNESGFNDYGGRPPGDGMRGSLGMRGGGRGGRGGGRWSGGGYGGGRVEGGGHVGFGGGGDYGFNSSFGDSGMSGSGETLTNQVTIPNDVAGAIIGKGGERIRNIRQRSGADIKIEDPQPGKSDRVITICGYNDQISYAQFLMQQSIRQHSHKK